MITDSNDSNSGKEMQFEVPRACSYGMSVQTIRAEELYSLTLLFVGIEHLSVATGEYSLHLRGISSASRMPTAVELDGPVEDVSGEVLELKRYSQAGDHCVSVAEAEDELEDEGREETAVVEHCTR